MTRPDPPRPPWELGVAQAPTPPHRSRGATWLAGALVLALVAWFGGAAAYGLRTDELPSTAATGYLPPDASRDVALVREGDARSQAMVEHARVRGTYLRWAVSPLLFRYTAPPPGVEGAEKADVRWWREGVATTAPDVASRYRVFSVTDAGIRMHGQDWGRLGLTLEPAPLWLPADVRPGRTWSSRGIATGAGLDGLLDYRMTARADAPRDGRDGCVQVTTTTRLTEQSDTPATTRWTERDLWCQGRGVVESAGTFGDVEYAVSTAGGQRPQPLPDNARRQTPDGTDLGSWQRRTLDAVEGDETFGSQPMRAPFDQGPVVPAGGSVVFGSYVTTDLVGVLPLDSGGHWLHWWARPGSQVLSLAAFGRTVVATTSDRRMLAYAAGGRLLWSVTLDDVALDAPVRVGEDRLAVASTSGVVSVHDAVDGQRLWSHRVPHGVSKPLASDGTVVAALDNAQQMHVLDARTGEERWTAEVELTARLLAVADGTTLVASSRVEAYDSRTGEPRWHRKMRQVDALEVGGGVVAADTPGGVELLDLDDGSTDATVRGADEPHRVGDAWFALAADSLVAFDDTGARRGAWRLEVPARDRDIVVGPTGVWVFGKAPGDDTLTGEWVGPRG